MKDKYKCIKCGARYPEQGKILDFSFWLCLVCGHHNRYGEKEGQK